MSVKDFSREYGTALYRLASEENASEAVFDDFSGVDAVFKKNPEFIRLLSNPRLNAHERAETVEKVFGGKINRNLLNFLKILAEKRRSGSVGKCFEVYKQLYCEDNGILPVKAYAAVEMSAEQKARLAEKLAKTTGKKILLETYTDPDCIGGIRLEYMGKRYDASIRGRLSGLLGNLKSPEIPEI